MLEFFGWLGALCFAICGVPQAWMSYKQGHSKGVSNLFLTLWLGGEIFTMIYILPKQDWPIVTNLVFNIIFILIIVWYKIWPRKSSQK